MTCTHLHVIVKLKAASCGESKSDSLMYLMTGKGRRCLIIWKVLLEWNIMIENGSISHQRKVRCTVFWLCVWYLWIYYLDLWILNILDSQSSVLTIFWLHTWITHNLQKVELERAKLWPVLECPWMSNRWLNLACMEKNALFLHWWDILLPLLIRMFLHLKKVQQYSSQKPFTDNNPCTVCKKNSTQSGRRTAVLCLISPHQKMAHLLSWRSFWNMPNLSQRTLIGYLHNRMTSSGVR